MVEEEQKRLATQVRVFPGSGNLFGSNVLEKRVKDRIGALFSWKDIIQTTTAHWDGRSLGALCGP